MEVIAIDAVTKTPISGATITVTAVGNHTGKEFTWGGFKTDATGRCLVRIPSRTIWIGGSEAFSGGFSRQLEIWAPGYRTYGISDEWRSGGEASKRFKDLKSYVFKMEDGRARR